MIVICNISALRIHERFGGALTEMADGQPIIPALNARGLSAIDIKGFRASMGDLHVIAPSRADRCQEAGVVSHVCTMPLPASSVRLVKPGVAVASVALAALLMSRTLSDHDVVRLLYELCATYRVNDYRTAHAPLARIDCLREEFAQLSNMRGSKRILMLSHYVADGSASPRETDLAMLVWLPHHLGGFGLPLGELNREVSIGRIKRRFDLFFRTTNVGIEYDSDENHAGARNNTDDAVRRKQLENHGFRVVPITNGELKNPQLTYDAVHLIAKLLNLRIRPPKGKSAEERMHLHRYINTPHVPFF